MEKLLKNKVMIIDDDESVILPIEMSLQEKGLETISFNDGIDALEYLKNNKVSVIILDYHMEPKINGDVFIKKLREFDNETLIYLHTAYSEELPAIDMLENYQIQGYIDKGKSNKERMQLIISAIKQAQTLELVKEQQKEIESRTYKEEFLGKFLGILMGEIKEKSFNIIGCIDRIEEYNNQISQEKEQFDKFINSIRKSTSDLNKLIETLDINKDTINKIELKNSLEKLFSVMCAYKNVNLNISISDEYKILNGNAKTIIYIMTDIIKYLIDKEEKDINIDIVSDESFNKIIVNNDISSTEILEKIYKLAEFDEKVNIYKEDKICIIC